MPQRHVTELLSAAYDGALTPAEKTRYDEHLATCAECAAEAERFTASVDALRALPRASMPQRVVLPSTPPQLEPRRRARLTLPAWLPRPALTPALGAAAMGALGIAAVVLVVHAHGGEGPSTTALGHAPSLSQAGGNQGGVGGGADQAAPGGAAQRSAIGIGTCPLPLALVPQAGSAAAPEGFSNRTTATDPHRPGEELVVATTATKVAPGSQLLIYAALTSTSGQHTAVVPCVSLHDATLKSTTETGGPGSPGPPAAAAAPAIGSLLSPDQVRSFAPYTLLPPLAVASPTSAAVANLPLQVLEIPAGTPHGARLQLVALVPSGLPGASDFQAIEAVLELDVS